MELVWPYVLLGVYLFGVVIYIILSLFSKETDPLEAFYEAWTWPLKAWLKLFVPYG
jgi:hypothetical protein